MLVGLSTSLKEHFFPVALFALSASALAKQKNVPDWVFQCEERPAPSRCFLLDAHTDWDLRERILLMMDKIDLSDYRAQEAWAAAEKLALLASDSVAQSILNTPKRRTRVNDKRHIAATRATATLFMAYHDAASLLDQYGCNPYLISAIEHLERVTDLIKTTPETAGLNMRSVNKSQSEIQFRIARICP